MSPSKWLLLAFPAVALADTPALMTRDSIMSAIELPTRAQVLRDDGVPVDEVAQALEASADRGVPAGQTAKMFESAHEAVKAHGAIDNFGDFVQSKLDEGLRGQDLAAAIRAEHEARGKGRSDAGRPDHVGTSSGNATMTRPESAPMTRPESKPKTPAEPAPMTRPEEGGR